MKKHADDCDCKHCRRLRELNASLDSIDEQLDDVEDDEPIEESKRRQVEQPPATSELVYTILLLAIVLYLFLKYSQ